jgi:FkbM family methyltransferase
MKKALLAFASWLAHCLPSSVKQSFYRMGPLSHWIRQTLNLAVPTGLSEITIAGGELAGCHFLLDLHEEKEYWLGTYEPDLQLAMKILVEPGWVIYDIGANIGYITLLLCKLLKAQGHVIAFEALPANVERLNKNLKMNPDISLVAEVIPAAVTNLQGTVRFLVSDSIATGKAEGSAGRQGKYHSHIDVDGITIDHFVYEQGHPIPQMIKMDIEGGEGLALSGMKRLLSESRPLFVIELHGSEANQIVWQILNIAKYSLFHLEKNYPLVNSVEELGKRSYIIAKPD